MSMHRMVDYGGEKQVSPAWLQMQSRHRGDVCRVTSSLHHANATLTGEFPRVSAAVERGSADRIDYQSASLQGS